MYGLTESNVRQIYYKIIEKKNELYNYFKSIPLAEKDAKYLTRVLNKIGITTVNDFSNRDFRNFLTLIAGISKRGQALLIKVKYPESFKLYEFIKQNTEKSFIKHRLYFILIDSGV